MSPRLHSLPLLL